MSGERFELHRHARAVGEFFDPHPGTQRLARTDLANDLQKKRCSTPGLGPRDFKRTELDNAERAHSVLAAAARGQMPGTLAAAVGAVTAAPARQRPPESDLLSLFAAHEELEGELVQEWLAGVLGPLSALVPDGTGDGLRGYEGALVALHEGAVDEARRAAILHELGDQDGRNCAPGSLHAGAFAEP